MVTQVGKLGQDVAGKRGCKEVGTISLFWSMVTAQHKEQCKQRNGVKKWSWTVYSESIQWVLRSPKTLKTPNPFPKRSRRTDCACSPTYMTSNKPNPRAGKTHLRKGIPIKVILWNKNEDGLKVIFKKIKITELGNSVVIWDKSCIQLTR